MWYQIIPAWSRTALSRSQNFRKWSWTRWRCLDRSAGWTRRLFRECILAGRSRRCRLPWQSRRVHRYSSLHSATWCRTRLRTLGSCRGRPVFKEKKQRTKVQQSVAGGGILTLVWRAFFMHNSCNFRLSSNHQWRFCSLQVQQSPLNRRSVIRKRLELKIPKTIVSFVTFCHHRIRLLLKQVSLTKV